MNDATTCAVEGCDRPRKPTRTGLHLLCRPHYGQAYRQSNPPLERLVDEAARDVMDAVLAMHTGRSHDETIEGIAVEVGGEPGDMRVSPSRGPRGALPLPAGDLLRACEGVLPASESAREGQGPPGEMRDREAARDAGSRPADREASSRGVPTPRGNSDNNPPKEANHG